MSETKVVHDLQVVGHRGNTPVLHEQFGTSLVSVRSRTEDMGNTYREVTTVLVVGPWKSRWPVTPARKKWWQR